jgi:hypothetical protein
MRDHSIASETVIAIAFDAGGTLDFFRRGFAYRQSVR